MTLPPAEPITLPDPRVRMTLEDLRAVQSIAARHITFSLTLACPLTCAHCIVDAAPNKGATTMPVETARRYAEQMPALAAQGIRSLSFTGGEPLLARQQLRLLSDAAHAAGMTSGVVTAAHWATSVPAARKVVDEFPGIACWDISVDAYHEKFIGLERIRNAQEAAVAAGRRVTLRFTHDVPLTEADQRLLAFISQMPDVQIASQKVRKVGRGRELEIAESDRYNPWTKPCMTQGLVVRYDGSLSPCCMNLVEERRHPFQLGDARERPLTDIHRDYMAQPLLQLIRAIGFTELLRWLEEAKLDGLLPDRLPDDACDVCALVVTDERMASVLARRAAEPANQLRIAVLASRLLGEHTMLHTVIRRFSAQAESLPGYAEAHALALSTGLEEEKQHAQ
jgi:pyruvate-formate lyase-activating enzyme